jgi:hypothetical protein
LLSSLEQAKNATGDETVVAIKVTSCGHKPTARLAIHTLCYNLVYLMFYLGNLKVGVLCINLAMTFWSCSFKVHPEKKKASHFTVNITCAKIITHYIIWDCLTAK